MQDNNNPLMKKIRTLNMMTIGVAIAIIIYYGIKSSETNNIAYGISILSLVLVILIVGLKIIACFVLYQGSYLYNLQMLSRTSSGKYSEIQSMIRNCKRK